MLRVADMVSPQGEAKAMQAAWADYVASAQDMIDAQFPALACTLGRDDRETLITHSHDAAKGIGFVTSADHLQYLVAVMFWGSFFASDPQFSTDLDAAGWHDQCAARPSLKRLGHRVDLYAQEVRGDLGSYARLLDNVAGVLRQDLTQPTMPQVCDACAHVWPMRARRLGQGGLPRFVTETGKRAHGLGLTGPDLVLYCVLALYFGHGFDCDPLYPWAIAAFAADTPEQCRHDLLAGMRGYFDARQGAKARAEAAA